MRSLDPNLSVDSKQTNGMAGESVPFISYKEIELSAHTLLEQVRYKSGPVDLAKVCSKLSLDLVFTEQKVLDSE